ncbi:hypothetical protein LBMAG18_12650 [Alphaproteobacteria bacterium]|nr:hypothetical protein LBMAG18_12650 [Alphaproteobacteria bacterium]
MLYPEIYSREITIINRISELNNIDISQADFIKIIENILSRSFIFCKRSDKVELSNNFCEIKRLSIYKHYNQRFWNGK